MFAGRIQLSIKSALSVKETRIVRINLNKKNKVERSSIDFELLFTIIETA